MTGPGSGLPDVPPLSPAVRSPRFAAAVVVVLALLIGVLIGAVASRRYMADHGRRSPFGFGGRGGPWTRGGPSDRMRQHFASELGLSATQVMQVDSIMSRSMAARQALEDSMRPRMRALLDSTRAQIEGVLTPDQRQKFEAMRAKDRAARSGGGGGPGANGGGGGPVGSPGAPGAQPQTPPPPGGAKP
jgi:Spy/CpxP family protein refolding chaperone